MIQPRKSGAGKVVACLFVLALLAGGYATITVLAPATGLALLTGRTANATTLKLKDTPTTHGDRLYIPKINIDVAINAGDSSDTLDKGAWHRKPENGDPAKGGNFVLSARRFAVSLTPQETVVRSPFYNIGELSEGDQLVVDYQGQRYGYVVSKAYTTTPNEADIEAQSTEPKLTLYSWTLPGSDENRIVVEAKPVKGILKVQ